LSEVNIKPENNVAQKLTVSINRTLLSAKMGSSLIPCIDTLRGMQFKRSHGPRIVLHAPHNAAEHR
jgi:hypothetical protein